MSTGPAVTRARRARATSEPVREAVRCALPTREVDVRGNGIRKRAARLAMLTSSLVLALLLLAAPVAGAADPVLPVAKGAACLPGTWSLNLPNSPAGLQGSSTTSDGSVTLQLGPGRQFLQTYASTVSTGQPGPNGTYLRTQQDTTGTVTARWTATARKMTLTQVRNDTTSVSRVAVDDRVSDPSTEQPAPDTFPAKRQSLAYRCSGTTLRLATAGGIAQGYTRTG